jgi:DNA processing protein
MDDFQDWLRLQGTPGVGAQTAAGLLRRYGSATAIFRQSESELRSCLRPALAEALRVVPAGLAQLQTRVAHWLSHPAPGVSHAVWTWADENYPPSLLTLADPPLLLYVQGQLDRAMSPALALVGSRNPTPQGLENARAFAGHLAEAGYCIVSGLAWGIDAAAHQGALDAPPSSDRWPTLAVVGTGLDRVYPERNFGLAQQIAHRGLLVSEYPPATAPMAHHFPQRNRLIAALSSAVLVVEASLKSGSLITAKLALELGREVMAIPGSIHSAQARGCHALIREGAKLVENAQDVLEELQLASPLQASLFAEALDPDLSDAADDAHPLLAHMGFAPVSLDALQARTGLDTASLQAQLLSLELDGILARLPGGLFQRLSQN